jgi:hypothetical protein
MPQKCDECGTLLDKGNRTVRIKLFSSDSLLTASTTGLNWGPDLGLLGGRKKGHLTAFSTVQPYKLQNSSKPNIYIS